MPMSRAWKRKSRRSRRPAPRLSMWSLGREWSLSGGGLGPREPEGGRGTGSPQEESEQCGGLVLRPAGRPRRTGSVPGLEVVRVSTLTACRLAVAGRRGGTWCRREPSAERRGQRLPQQQVHWGGLRGHQWTAVPAAGVSTQTPSLGSAQACLDGLCPPNTKSGPGPPHQALTPNPLSSAQVTRNGQ